MSDTSIINVNMADMKLARPPSNLRTVLGSCIGVFFYEPRMKIGGMVHVLLPEHPDGSLAVTNAAKFATTGIPALLELMQKEGAQKKILYVKFAEEQRCLPALVRIR